MTPAGRRVVPRVNRRLSEVWREIERAALGCGALRVGASNLADAHAALFDQWIEHGHDATMSYLRKNRGARMQPAERFPWARSVVVVTVPYSPHRTAPSPTLAAHAARYALGDDYHEVLDSILRKIEEVLKRVDPGIQTRRYVDTGPLSDRAYAAQAGLGWIGKNGMLIDPDHGSYTFIGTLLTSLENDLSAEEVADRCGSCTRCLEACPTSAILPDRTVAAKACISYLTIEHRGRIDDELKPLLAGYVFGCDICNEVCPWNAAPAEGLNAFETREGYRATPVSDLLRMSQSDYSRMFRNSAMKRAKRAGLLRNAILASETISPDAEQALAEETDEGIQDALRWRRNVSG